jgi:hypothetical protein
MEKAAGAVHASPLLARAFPFSSAGCLLFILRL